MSQAIPKNQFGKNGAYSYRQDIPLTGEIASVSATLLTWLSSQLVEGESLPADLRDGLLATWASLDS